MPSNSALAARGDACAHLAFTPSASRGWVRRVLIYVRLFDALLPAKTAWTAAAKVALDQFVYVPFVFFPAFYTVDAVVRREEPVLLAARDRYLREIWRTCVDTWPFSIAAQFVGFRFVPSHLLIPYVTCCSFVFTGLVSGLQGKFRLAERQGVALPPPKRRCRSHNPSGESRSSSSWPHRPSRVARARVSRRTRSFCTRLE